MFRHSSHPGNGKSTLINALVSLAYEDYQAKAIANGAQKHVTRKTEVHAFQQNAGFAFIDTFGLTKVWARDGLRLGDQ
jgi:putative ribosome biogenesis GTPase RsgA